MKARDILIYLSLLCQGDWKKITQKIQERFPIDAEKAKEEISKLKCNVVTLVDKNYPEVFKGVLRPPFVLYYYGNISLIKDYKRCIAYVGSRDASDYGLKMAEKLCGDLARDGFTIVSGLAIGIDGAAAKAALPYKKAVGVLGCGIDIYYPKTNTKYQRQMKTDGLVLSEYPPGVNPFPDLFPSRNRIIAGLSCCTIVGEASTKSGTMITVSHALGYGREVVCVPFRADEDSMCNKLIKDGAAMVENVEDIYDAIGFYYEKPKQSKLDLDDV